MSTISQLGLSLARTLRGLAANSSQLKTFARARVATGPDCFDRIDLLLRPDRKFFLIIQSEASCEVDVCSSQAEATDHMRAWLRRCSRSRYAELTGLQIESPFLLPRQILL